VLFRDDQRLAVRLPADLVGLLGPVSEGDTGCCGSFGVLALRSDHDYRAERPAIVGALVL
jgi:hypothetical protein